MYTIGIDLGGTKILTALCDQSGEIIVQHKVSTERASGETQVIQRICDSIDKVLEQPGFSLESVSAIGISSPGPLHVASGVVISAPLLNWHKVPVCRILQQKFGIPVYLENDGNAAAYGEMLLGAGKESENIIYITLSTGIGCGIIIDRKIYHGKHDSAGELGHICVESGGKRCACGNPGCYEMYASGTAIAEMARERVTQDQTSRILSLSGNNIQDINCIHVAEAAYAGDRLALQIWADVSKRLGQGISIVMQLFDPDIIIIGGGVSQAWQLFYEQMRNTVLDNIFPLIAEDMQIVPAQLGQNAGVIGAALLAGHNFQQNKIYRYKE